MAVKPVAPGAPSEGGNSANDLPHGQVEFEGASVKLKFSEPFSASTVAGCGRYFAFHLKKAKTVVILDILQGKFVDSVPPHRAIRGRTFKYKPAVTSKAGDVKLALESGPKDMALSADGELRWNVPSHTDEAMASVILRVSDRAGGELFHTFELTVESAPVTLIEGP